MRGSCVSCLGSRKTRKISAGLLLFRRHPGLQVFLVHPGGRFWSRRDAGAWTIPKGEIDPGEDALAAATREFVEETGFSLNGPFDPMAPVTQAGGKIVQAWRVEGDCAAWFTISEARMRINPAQTAFLDELCRALDAG